jgi:hypothetical protein
MHVNEPPTKRTTKHASKGNKRKNDHNSNNNPLMCVDAMPGDNEEHPAPLSNDNDSDAPMPVDELPTKQKTKHASKGKKHDRRDGRNNNHDGGIPMHANTDPAPLLNDAASIQPTPTTNILVPIPAVETRGGAAGDDTHPVSPTTAGPRAGSLQFLYIVLYSINSKHLDTIM